MSEQLSQPRPEKTEAEIADQIVRITNNLGERAMRGMDVDAVYIPQIRGDESSLAGIHDRESGVTTLYPVSKQEDSTNMIEKDSNTVRLIKRQAEVVKKPKELVGEDEGFRLKELKVSVDGGKVSGTYTNTIEGKSSAKRSSTHTVELTKDQQIKAAASALSKARSALVERESSMRDEANKFIMSQ